MNEAFDPLKELKELIRKVYEAEEAARLSGGGGTAHFIKTPGLDEGDAEFDPNDLNEEDLAVYNVTRAGGMAIDDFNSYIKPLASEYYVAKKSGDMEKQKVLHSRYLFAQYVANVSKFK
jgi:hypothetical protein